MIQHPTYFWLQRPVLPFMALAIVLGYTQMLRLGWIAQHIKHIREWNAWNAEKQFRALDEFGHYNCITWWPNYQGE